MYWSRNSMNNLLSYCGLVDEKIRASDKDLPVCLSLFFLAEDRPVIGTFGFPIFLNEFLSKFPMKKLDFCLQKLSKLKLQFFFTFFSFLNFSRVEFCYSLGRVLRFSFQKREIIFSKTAKLLFQKSLQFKNITYMHFFLFPLFRNLNTTKVFN